MFNTKLHENCKRVKIDIGLSYSAPHSQLWLDKNPNDLVVFGFEPAQDCIDAIMSPENKKRDEGHGEPLKRKYIDNGHFILNQYALGNVENKETRDFYINENDVGTSSLYKPISNILGPLKKKVTVDVVSLKMFFDKFPWDKIDHIEYIKIDAQGEDLNILKGAGNYLQERVVYVTAEPGSYGYYGAEENSVNNISNYMFKQGFIKINHPNTVDPTFINKKFFDKKDDIFICQLS